MHKDELWQVYAPNGEPVDGEGWDSALDNPEKTGSDKIVGIAIVFLYRFNDAQELEFLWQRRSKTVDRYPGDYDISAGGHINLGESLVEAAVREAYEEIGAEITTSDLQFMTEAPFNRNRFAWVYAVDWTGRPDEFKFDDGEVSEVKWVPYAKMEEFRAKYAKKPLREDEFTFMTLRNWLEMHGMVKSVKKKVRNYAFIDGNNLYLGAKSQGIRIDYRKLRLYLKNKLDVERALLFLGYDKSRIGLYSMLKKCGFELVFKPAFFYSDRNGNKMMKGNVDAELVLYSAAVEYDYYDKAIVITGDGDFACLMEYLPDNNKLRQIITPTEHYSLLLRKYKGYISQLKGIARHVEM